MVRDLIVGSFALTFVLLMAALLALCGRSVEQAYAQEQSFRAMTQQVREFPYKTDVHRGAAVLLLREHYESLWTPAIERELMHGRPIPQESYQRLGLPIEHGHQ